MNPICSVKGHKWEQWTMRRRDPFAHKDIWAIPVMSCTRWGCTETRDDPSRKADLSEFLAREAKLGKRVRR